MADHLRERRTWSWRGNYQKFGWTKDFLSRHLFWATVRAGWHDGVDLQQYVPFPAARDHAHTLHFARRSDAILALSEAIES